MIYLIYMPPERNLAEKLADAIQKQSLQTCSFAPMGLQALTEEWKLLVRHDIEVSDAVCLIMTEQAFKDESVIWRIEQVLQPNKLIIPIAWDISAWDVSHVPSPSEIDSRIKRLVYINFASVSKASEERDLSRLVEVLPKSPNKNCFLSYSRKDTDFAVKLASDLRAAKLKTWRDAENIPAGANWDREIEKAVKECTHLILVASPSSIESENVMDEVSIAINKGKTVIPVMIETCELPMRVHRAQWVDFRDGYDQGLKKLLEQLGVKKSE